MLRINLNLFPRSGYWFQDSDGVKIRGKSWPDVMRRVEAYRKRAGREIGNVENEVNVFACARNPSFCSEINEENVRQLKVTSLKGRVLKYLSFLRGLIAGNHIPWVSAQDAANRANVCATCPQNTPLPEGCSSCRAAVRAMQKEILGGRAIDARLNGCAILGESIPCSVWIDHDVVASDALPGHCWRKRRPPA